MPAVKLNFMNFQKRKKYIVMYHSIININESGYYNKNMVHFIELCGNCVMHYCNCICMPRFSFSNLATNCVNCDFNCANVQTDFTETVFVKYESRVLTFGRSSPRVREPEISRSSVLNRLRTMVPNRSSS